MPLPAFQTVGAAVGNVGANITPAMPAGIAANDTLIGHTAMAGGALTCSTPSGWNLGGFDNSSAGVSAYWFWRNAVGGDTSPTFVWSSGAVQGYGQISRFNGANTPASPIGNKTTAHGSSQKAFSVPGIVSTANNSLMVYMVALDGGSKAILPGVDYTQYVQAGSNSNTSRSHVYGAVFVSGQTSNAYENGVSAIGAVLSLTAFNWAGLGFEIVGSGVGTIADVRDTGVTAQVLSTYSNPKFVRDTGVSQQVLASYSNPKFVRATGVVIQVLRTVGTTTPPVPPGWVTIQC